MQRWNGWGDTAYQKSLTSDAVTFLKETLNTGDQTPDVRLADVVKQVPESRLPDHALIDTDPAERVRHATGQSLPDWIAMRYGTIAIFPDGVARPATAEDVRSLLHYAKEAGVRLIPYGGGTSVVGHINPLPGDAPVLTVNMQRMNSLLNLDETAHLATFGAGIAGPDLEAQLRARGFMLGHFPQSFEYATLGGWIATRSSGQQSLYYGRIETLFAGGCIEQPAGTLTLPPIPWSAAGPDLRDLVLGSEGRLGIITEATVRITPLPQRERFSGIFFPDFTSGMTAVRQMAQEKLPLSMLRLSNARETTTNLLMAGHKTAINLLERYLRMRGADTEKCMLIAGITGSKTLFRAASGRMMDIARAYGGVNMGRIPGDQWKKNRFKGAYLRNTLWDAGYAVDTLETAVPWNRTQQMMTDIEQALSNALADEGERVHVFTHLSHMYSSGSSVYTTYIFRRTPDPDELLARWRKLKGAASDVIVRHGGTISHQHGVGIDHAPYLAAEKSQQGLDMLESLLTHADPDGILNPGKLITQTRLEGEAARS